MITIGVPGRTSVLGAVRQINKRVLNPVMLQVAGRRFSYTAVIHHTGRRSGRAFATPVVAVAIDNGYLIPLPYGSGVDWLANLSAAGHATLDVGGRTVAVGDPQILERADALRLLTPAWARSWRVVRVSSFVRLTISPPAPKPPRRARRPVTRVPAAARPTRDTSARRPRPEPPPGDATAHDANDDRDP